MYAVYNLTAMSRSYSCLLRPVSKRKQCKVSFLKALKHDTEELNPGLVDHGRHL